MKPVNLVISIFLTLLFAFPGYGQTTIQQLGTADQMMRSQRERSQSILDSIDALPTLTLLESTYLQYLQGRMAYLEDNNTLAIQYQRRAMRNANKLKNDSLLVWTATALSRIHAYQGSYPEALSVIDSLANYRFIQWNNTLKSMWSRSYGNLYIEQGDFVRSSKYYAEAAQLDSLNKDTTNLINSLYNLALDYFYLGEYDKALEIDLNALQLAELTQDTRTIAICLNNIGGIYERKEDYPKALKYYQEALPNFKEADYKVGYARSLANIGNMHSQLQQFDKALTYVEQAIHFNEERKDTRSIAKNYNDLGLIYQKMQNYKASIDHFKEAIIFCEESNYKYGLILNYSDMGASYLHLKDYSKAKMYLQKSNTLLQDMSDNNIKMLNLKLLAKIYEALGQYQNAYQVQKEAALIHDTINSQSVNETIARLESKYEFRKMEQQIKAQKKELDLKQRIINKSRLIWLLFAIVSVTGSTTLIILSRANHLKRKSHKEISEKNKLLEVQQNMLTDSIYYAERIQSALYASPEDLIQHFPNSFLLNLPKDIVSGDFIWSKVVGDKIALAVADCTGHGVPGAFMSILGISFLNEVPDENFQKSPGEILNRMRTFIKKSLRQNGDIFEGKDGIDIALCIFEADFSSVELASAQLPVYHISKNQVHKIAYDRQPIGVNYIEEPFQTQRILLEPGDQFLAFSDGMIDQLNNQRKRYNSGRFKKQLLALQDQSPEDIKNGLLSALSSWKEQTEQTDDILVFGMKV